MRKIPITFREKIEARYIRRGVMHCWMWDGGLVHGQPAFMHRLVRRDIYEWERGPIPPGHALWRTDHTFPECKDIGYQCRHRFCVNPWHCAPDPRGGGLYTRPSRLAQSLHETQEGTA